MKKRSRESEEKQKGLALPLTAARRKCLLAPGSCFMLPCSPMYKVPSGLAPAIFIPGLAYEALIRVRNHAYSAGWIGRRKLSRPVISVGNLTLGGSGKTPLVIYIAGELLRLGFIPAVLSRGYGRNSRGVHVLRPGASVSNPESTLGDEPALIRRRVPESWIGISNNRFMAGRALERQTDDMVFILDDGFQHRKLCRDLDIVIIDCSQPLESNRVFPRGTLREPAAALHRCDAIVLNGRETGDAEKKIRELGIRAEIFRCEQRIEQLIPFVEWQKSETPLPTQIRTAYVVAALANPERFLQDVLRFGIAVPSKKFFADHHRLSRSEWTACSKEARAQAVDAILTTEKDAVKIESPPDFPLHVAAQSTKLSDQGAFERLLKKLVEERV
jgi:tetraacyldisaccharide 4'-kinase